MRTAFKEWAVVVDALGRGEQSLILRKGGISEEGGEFRPEHSRFLLFPTRFHQQRESVIPAARPRCDQVLEGLPREDVVRIEFMAEVVCARGVDDPKVLEELRGQHIWTDEVVEKRFNWGEGRNIVVMEVKVWRLARAVELPMLEEYGGCRSWVELEVDVEVEGAAEVRFGNAGDTF